MNPSISFPKSQLFHTVLLVLIFQAISSHGSDDPSPFCEPFYCGDKQISYPFRNTTQPEYCGFVLDCESKTDQYPLLEVKSQKFHVLDINPRTRTLKMARLDLSDKVCLENFTNTTFESTPFNYTPKDLNVTLFYDCNDQVQDFPDLAKFSCPINNAPRRAYFADTRHKTEYLQSFCNISVVVPVMKDGLGGWVGKGIDDVEKVLKDGFEVEWNDEKCKECLADNGSCGHNTTANQFVCFCTDLKPHHQWNCTLTPHSQPAYALSFDLLIKPVLAVVLISVFTAFPSPSLGQSPLINPTLSTECASKLYTCGDDIRSLIFPFWGNDTPDYCGQPGFELRCVSQEYSLIDIDGLDFRILSVDQTNHNMTLARNDLWESPCSPTQPRSAALNRYFFAYPPTVENLTLLHDCSSGIDGRSIDSFPNSYRCPGEDGQSLLYMNDSFLSSVSDELEECWDRIYRVAVSRDALDQIELLGDVNLTRGLRKGFQVNYMDFARCYQCSASNGICGFDRDEQFQCNCHEGFKRVDSGSLCAPRHGKSWKIKAILGVSGGVIAVLCYCITICCYRKTRSCVSNISKKDQDIEAFIRSNGDLTAKRYRFLEVKKITKSFKDKVGQGGYGEVYKGRLQDGRLVAVKLLNLAKGNGEEFINEVASISRTSHVNIVTLLGFCLEGGKRALIYEFMPNGSLEKFVYNDESYRTYPNLEWEQMLRIATGIARGLEYLHRGCNTRILHFDIKPHNILLDEDLCPKISDFGLAKLCPNKQSNISLLDARGTVGYIAPEVFNRNFGRVSSKSDVYSYGMMALEMVGGRKNIKVGVSRTSKIYFPDWIYKQIKVGSDLRLLGDMTSEENGTARKMIIVGLWCIQIAPSDRPSMSKVIEMLEGSLEALQIPPKPTLISPTSTVML